MKSLPAVILVAVGLLTGCVNPHEKFYVDLTRGDTNSCVSSSAVPEIRFTKDIMRDDHRLFQKNYVMIGYSAFTKGDADTSGSLLEHAKKVGASVVLYQSLFSHDETQMKTLIYDKPGQTYQTQTYGNIYGGGGMVNYYANSTTRSSGSWGSYQMPVNVRIYRHMASFWKQGKPQAIGLKYSPIPDELRKELGRNQGILVTIVLDDSPAFKANVLEGDVIIRVDGKEVAASDVPALLKEKYGQKEVSLTVLRGKDETEIKLHPDWSVVAFPACLFTYP